ncbi:MAG: hypothetical protein KDB23_17770, partial [Planctomycetales bacterium]|nr:hypothetical protein [Planctomycetales bacterium]
MAKFRRGAVCFAATVVAVVAGLVLANKVSATTLILKNGMLLEGKLGSLDSVAVNPLVVRPTEASQVKLIVLLDDELRRMMVSRYQVEPDSLQESDPSSADRILIKQNVARGNKVLESLAGIRATGPFDEFGRRTIS